MTRRRNAPIALVKLEDGSKVYMLVTEGMGIDETVAWGTDVEVKNGNTLPLQSIPTGSYICNIESRPNDGGKFVRSTGVRQLSSTRSVNVWVYGCRAARPNGSTLAAVQLLALSPVVAALRSRLSKPATNLTR